MVNPYNPNRRARSPQSGCCPTCGVKSDVPDRVFVDIFVARIARGDLCIQVDRRKARFVQRLLDSWPHPVNFEDLIEATWPEGAPASARGDYWQKPYNLVHVIACDLRRDLRPLGINISFASRNSHHYSAEIIDIPSPLRIAS